MPPPDHLFYRIDVTGNASIGFFQCVWVVFLQPLPAIIPIPGVAGNTGLGIARNVLVVKNGDVVVAVSGGAGTLSEIGIALKIGRPVVALGHFDAIDGVPVDLLFVLLVPEAATDAHLDLLRQIASMLDRQDVRERLRQAKSGEDLYQVVVDIQNGQ